MTTCIYCITSTINGKQYIGSAVNYTDRKSKHIRDLKKNIHHNTRLQNHCNKYGIEDLCFSILKLSNRENLIVDEQYFIDSLNPFFNIARIAGSTIGISMQPHVKLALANSQHKIVRDKEYRDNMSKSLVGRVFTQAHKDKIGIKHKNKVLSDNTKALISKSRIGKYKGIENGNSKQVLCLNNNIIYDCAKDAAKHLGISDKHIGSVCNGNRNHTYNYQFKHVN